jgi:hypothetical protein
MATAEDVFHLYERNLNYYTKCSNIDLCPTKNCDECYCQELFSVKPITIGEQDIKCNFIRKCYIRPGQECSICLEPIIKKSEAYLTYCGHGFHKKCIFNSFEKKWSQKYCSTFRCPLCRRNLVADIANINIRYQEKWGQFTLDHLEDFWYRKDFILPQYCPNGWQHYEGLNSECSCCIRYRKYGN